jgi:hypothetical protein
MLIKRWLEDATVDISGKEAYLLSSAKGKGLYEKLGWKVKHELVTPLDEFVGKKEVYKNWSMVREVGSK